MVVGPRLVLDLEEEIVKGVQLPHQPAGQPFLHGERGIGLAGLFQVRFRRKRVQLLPRGDGKRLDVVSWIERMDRPLLVAVRGAEQRELDDDAPLVGFANECFEPREILGREAFEIKLVAATHVARPVAPSPRREELARCGRKRVALDTERALRLDITAGEDAGVVHPVVL